MGLKVIRQTLSTEATKVIEGYTYNVNYVSIDNVLSVIAMRIYQPDTGNGMMECGSMNRDEVNTYINIASGEDVFKHSTIMSEISKEIEGMYKKKEPESDEQIIS